LYSNNYDLHDNLNVKDTKYVLNGIYHEFLDMFNKLYENPNYFIIDFKCGEDKNHDGIHWIYSDMKKGYKFIDGTEYLFVDCLPQNVTIKIDIIYVLNNVFTDITNNYFLHQTNNKSELHKVKDEKLHKVISELEEPIIEA